MEINGIPLHPLVVHAAVVFSPLAGLAAIAYALVPQWRGPLRWPLPVLGLISALSLQLADMTGEDLKHKLGEHSALLETHEMWAGRLVAVGWVLAGLTVVAWLFAAVPARSPGSFERAPRSAAVELALKVLLPLVGLTILYVAYKTGDAGAAAVWKG